MKTINKYLAKQILIGLAIALGITTFVMLMGQFAKVFDLLSRGISLQTLFLYVYYRIPQALGYTIPLGLFVSTVLTFHHMSSDHEITALRASGISLSQIIAPIVLLSLGLSLFCLHLQFNVSPECQFRAKSLVREAGAQNPLLLVEDGRFVEMFDGYIIYVGDKTETELWDVHLYVLNEEDQVQQKIDAEKGEISVNETLKTLELTLYNATIETLDPDDPNNVSKIRRVRGETCSFGLEYGDKVNSRELVRNDSEMRLSQLFARVQIQSERGIDATPLYVEMHQRAALALSPFSFVLLGIPLGIRLPRREASFSLFGCVFVPFAYFVLLSFFETMRHTPQYEPEFLMWIPNIACQIIGIVALWIKR